MATFNEVIKESVDNVGKELGSREEALRVSKRYRSDLRDVYEAHYVPRPLNDQERGLLLVKLQDMILLFNNELLDDDSPLLDPETYDDEHEAAELLGAHEEFIHGLEMMVDADHSKPEAIMDTLDHMESARESALSRKLEAGPGTGLEAMGAFVRLAKRLLAARGIKHFESMGKPFDPNLHEAIQVMESDKPPETVAAVHREGYHIHDRLLRPAMVSVSGGLPAWPAWDSIGKRVVTRKAAKKVSKNGADHYLVPSAHSVEGKLYEYIPVSEWEEYRDWDAKILAQEQAKAKAKAAPERQESLNTYGYLESLDPMARGRARKVLEKQRLLNGTPVYLAKWVPARLDEGWRITLHPRSKHPKRFSRGAGTSFFTPKDITATAFKYAEFLSSKKQD